MCHVANWLTSSCYANAYVDDTDTYANTNPTGLTDLNESESALTVAIR